MTAVHPSLETNNKSASGHFYIITLSLLIILASIERIYGIDRQSLWSDELFAVMASYKQNWHNLWVLLVNDSHPPGYVMLMYWTFPLTGYSDVGVRLHALLYGILWIPLVYWIGKRWFSPQTGLLAAALITSSFTAIYFSQEARAYSMLVTFCLGNLVCFLEIIFAKKCHRGYLIGYIISSSLILYLHYTCFVFFATEGLLYLVYWLTRYRKGSIVEMLKIFGIPLLVYAPWMGVMIGHLTDDSRGWVISVVPTLLDVYYTFQNLWGPDYRLLDLYIYGLLAALLLSGYLYFKKGSRRDSVIIYTLAVLLVVPVLAFYIESVIWTPIFEKRYFIITLPLMALLMSIIVIRVLQTIVHPQWQKLSVLTLICLFTVWSISSNIDNKLYNQVNKDPVRDAVALVKADLQAQSITDGYTILMTHDWFEHYLKRANITFDKRWPYHVYDAPHKIPRIVEYMQQRPDIRYFYYLSLTAQNTESAIFGLKQRYKFISSAKLAIPSGSITVSKFDTKAEVDSSQLDGSTNNINEAVKAIAQDIGKKDPATYTTLVTHEWMDLYVTRNKVSLDKTWPGRNYSLDLHFPDVASYLQQHPAIDTLYYMALRSPAVDDASLILQLQYSLLSKKTVVSTVGNIDIYKFNTRVKPAFTQELRDKTKNNPINLASALVGKYTRKVNANTYGVIMSHDWFMPYLRLNGVYVDESWGDRNYGGEFQSAGVFQYVKEHPAMNTLYYLRLEETHSGNRLVPLLLQYQLISSETVNSPVGKLQVFRFDTKSNKTSDSSAFTANFSSSPIYLGATAIAKNTNNKSPASYVALMTHPFFNLYLKSRGIAIDNQWSGRFYTTERESENVFSYVAEHPTLTDVYYLAFRTVESEQAATALQKRYRLVSKNTFESSAGKIDAYQFGIK